MSELRDLTLLRVGSNGELDRFFERFVGWPVGDGTCWVSIGGGQG